MAIEGRGLGTPNFSVSAGQSAHAVAALGIVRVCGHYHEPSRPLGLYSTDACFLAGAGRLAVLPVNADWEEVHPYMMLLGFRWGLSWQRSPGVYFRSFIELGLNPLNVNLSFNSKTVWGGWNGLDTVPAHFGGVLGFEFNLVSAQPASWDHPVRNPHDDVSR